MGKKYFNQNSVTRGADKHQKATKKERDKSPAPVMVTDMKPVATTAIKSITDCMFSLSDVMPQDEIEKAFSVGDAFSKFIANYLFVQMALFVMHQDGLESKTVNERKEAENDLYSIAWGVESHVIDNNRPEDYDLYMVDRSVRIDRETHKLNRASCTIIAMASNTHKISYTVTAYLTSRYTGTVVVVPVGDDGPLYKSSARYNFNMSDRA